MAKFLSLRFAFGFCALLFSLEASTRAQPPPGSFRFQKVASWPGYARGEVMDIQFIGNLAFMAMGEGGLCIADYSNPTNPTILSRVDLPGTSQVVKVTPNHAYLCAGEAGLYIVSISNPAAPTLVGQYKSASEINEVTFSGQYAFLAAGSEGVIALDVTNPASPNRVGALATGGEGLDVEVNTIGASSITSRRLYLADGTNGIVQIDALNPASMRRITRDETGGTISVSRVGLYLFYLDAHSDQRTGSIWFRDLRAPGFGDLPVGFLDFVPRKFIPRVDATGRPIGGYVIDSAGFLYSGFFNISTPGIFIPSPVSNPFTARAAVTTPDFNVFAVSAVGVQTMVGTNVLSILAPGGSATRVKLGGNRIYVADGYQGLHILDAKPDGSLAHLSTHYAGFQRGFDVSGSNVFLTAGTNVQILDVANGSAPVVLTNIAPILTNRPTVLSPREIAVYENRCYVSGLNLQLSVLDVSNPEFPNLLRKTSVRIPLFSMNFSGSNLYASTAPGFVSLQLAPDNEATILKRDSAFASTTGSQVVESTAYFCDRLGGLRIFDVSNPSEFVLRSTFDTPGTAVAVTVVGDLAYVADSTAGVVIVNVADPGNPNEVATLQTPNSALDVQVRGNRLFIANGAECLTVWDMVPVQIQTINFPAIADASVVDDPFTITLPAASSGLPVSLSITGPATLTGNRVTLSGAPGIVRIVASQAGNGDFTAATIERFFTVRDVPSAATAYVQSKNPSLPPDLTLPNADADRDGISNLAEFFFKSDPTDPNDLQGRTTAYIYQFGSSRYLIARYPKPRTTRYPMAVQVADLKKPHPRTWTDYAPDFSAGAYGEFPWRISNDGSLPIIRFVVKYP